MVSKLGQHLTTMHASLVPLITRFDLMPPAPLLSAAARVIIGPAIRVRSALLQQFGRLATCPGGCFLPTCVVYLSCWLLLFIALSGSHL